MANTVKGILFDLGDTLLDFGRVDIRTLFEAGAALAYKQLGVWGLKLPPFAHYHRRQNWAIRWNYLKSRITRREFNALYVIGRMAASMGHELSAEQKVELAGHWYQPLSVCAVVEEGTVELLAEFRKAGLTLGLVSNTFVPVEVLDMHLARVGLLELLPVRVYSCVVRYRKPDARIFAHALKQCGLLPAETIFVGDSPRADIEGANRAGMISVLKDPTGKHAASRCNPAHRIRKLTELREIVAGYNHQ